MGNVSLHLTGSRTMRRRACPSAQTIMAGIVPFLENCKTFECREAWLFVTSFFMTSPTSGFSVSEGGRVWLLMIWFGHVISRDVSMQTSLQLQSLLQGCSLPWTYETSREHVDILTYCIGSPGITHCSARLSFSDRKRRPPSFDLEMIYIFFL